MKYSIQKVVDPREIESHPTIDVKAMITDRLKRELAHTIADKVKVSENDYGYGPRLEASVCVYDADKIRNAINLLSSLSVKGSAEDAARVDAVINYLMQGD